ncbi:MAG: N-acetylmuramoyl-L-alanine amidase [Armatimonadota bacterium]
MLYRYKIAAIVLLITVCSILNIRIVSADVLTLVAGGRQISTSNPPFILDQTVYIPDDALRSIGALVSKTGRRSGDEQKAVVIMRNGNKISCNGIYISEKLMIPVTDIADKACIDVDWSANSKVVTLRAIVTGISFDGSQLRVTTSYPVAYKVDFWKAANRLIVQLNDAVYPPNESDIEIINSTQVNIRRGMDKDIARIVMDMPNCIDYKTTSTSVSSIITANVSGLNKETALVADNPITQSFDAAPQQVMQDTIPAPQPAVVSTVPSIINRIDFNRDGNHNIHVAIYTDTPVKYTTYMYRNPERLIMDISNAVVGSGIKDIDVNHEILRSISITQKPANKVRIAMELERVVSYNVSNDTSSGCLEVSIDLPKGAGGSISKRIIVIDPGHGGPTKVGACGLNGIREKDITLAIAKQVQTILKSNGVAVLLTRDGDVELDRKIDIDLQKRVDMAARNSADFFVSIHCNAVSSPKKISGTETYYHGVDTNGRALAESIHPELLSAGKLYDRRIKSDFDRYSNGFSVLRNASEKHQIPAILIETGFIDHPGDSALLIDPVYQRRIAEGIVKGLKTYVEGNPVIRQARAVDDESPVRWKSSQSRTVVKTKRVKTSEKAAVSAISGPSRPGVQRP